MSEVPPGEPPLGQAEEDGPRTLRGEIAEVLAEEYPGLALHTLALTLPEGLRPSDRSPPEVLHRLATLSSRFRGSNAVVMRQAAVPWAYRLFYRHIGLDPDTDRTPVEAAALERLMQGGFKSQALLDDALTVALVETGVPVWALDADRVDGPLNIRLARPGETLGRAEALPRRRGRAEKPPSVPSRRIVVADARGPLAVLFGPLAAGHGVTKHSRGLTLFTVQVAGVPTIAVEEALWSCAEILGVELR